MENLTDTHNGQKIPLFVKLFTLLENGSNLSIKQNAAEQIALSLLSCFSDKVFDRVIRCLSDPSWDTRIATGYMLSVAMQSFNFQPEHNELLEDEFNENIPLFKLGDILSCGMTLLSDSPNLISDGQSQSKRIKHTDFPQNDQIYDKQTVLDFCDRTIGQILPSILPEKTTKMEPNMIGLLRVITDGIFDLDWETRHGSAVALRELMKNGGQFWLPKLTENGSCKPVSTNEHISLVFVALRIICVLALDKFGDFVSGEMVAPVRETLAQSFSHLLAGFSESICTAFLSLSVRMLGCQDHNVRHSGLLIFKYISVDKTTNISYSLWPTLLFNLKECLSVNEEEVNVAQAAIILTNVVDQFIKLSSLHQLRQVAHNTITILNETSDLSCSSDKALSLLTCLIQKNGEILKEHLSQKLLHRIVSFFENAHLHFRLNAFSTFSQAISLILTHNPPLLTFDILLHFMKHIFSLCFMEIRSDVRESMFKCWECLVEPFIASLYDLQVVIVIDTWLLLASQGIGSIVPETLINVGFAFSPSSTVNIGEGELSTLPTNEREETVYKIRLTLCCMIARVVERISGEMSNVIQKLFCRHLSHRNSVHRQVVLFTLTEILRVYKMYQLNDDVVSVIKDQLGEIICYEEDYCNLSTLNGICYNTLVEYSNLGFSHSFEDMTTWTCSSAMALEDDLLKVIDSLDPESEKSEALCRLCSTLSLIIKQCSQSQYINTNRVRLASSMALLFTQDIGERLSPVVKPIMESIQHETNRSLQFMAASLVPVLVIQHPKLASKLFDNLKKMAVPMVDLLKDSLYSMICDETSLDSSTVVASLFPEWSSGLSAPQKFRFSYTHVSFAEPLNDLTSFDNQRIGAELAVMFLCESNIPEFEQFISHQFAIFNSSNDGTLNDDELLCKILFAELVVPYMSQIMLTKYLCNLSILKRCLCHLDCLSRHLCARFVGILASSSLRTLTFEWFFGELENKWARLGIIETIYHIIETKNISIYVPVLITSVLSSLGDQVAHVRSTASLCFSKLVELFPLQSAYSVEQVEKPLHPMWLRGRMLLDNLHNQANIFPIEVPKELKTTLRPYQLDGISWLNFITTYGLHGILADDMGLGKTLQIIVLLHNYYKSSQTWKPSLVVCPVALTTHWAYEIDKFFDDSLLSHVIYSGSKKKRERLQELVFSHKIILVSYEIIRHDIVFFTSVEWDFCILDEGHVIKNPNNKISKSLKSIRCKHRLLLSGTPVQSKILDIWALFDFLMPGFLGSEKSFNKRFVKSVIPLKEQSNSSVLQSSEGLIALRSLHKNILPFILRRVKEDVLHDLPPKTIQDYHCHMSELQVALYDALSKIVMKKSTVSDQTWKLSIINKSRLICNHPALLKNIGQYYDNSYDLSDISVSGKLVVLKEILENCGIGSDSLITLNSRHRVVIFCQTRAFIDIIISDLLCKHMPDVLYMRLDGTVQNSKRVDYANRFNSDPSFEIMLATTRIAGHGLNLTGANVIIFMDHDWNPCSDMQAMDRAHRIGQQKAVNVYRLITRDTIEDKIMNLQRFKKMVSSTIISEDNNSLSSMATNELFDIFASSVHNNEESHIPNVKKGVSESIIREMGELWDESQYTDEFE